jgi:hypothetical protein
MAYADSSRFADTGVKALGKSVSVCVCGMCGIQ